MTSGYATYSVTQGQKYQAEAKSYAEDSDFWSGEHGASARQKHEKHRAKKFSD